MKLLRCAALAVVIVTMAADANAQGTAPPQGAGPLGPASPSREPMGAMPMHHPMRGVMPGDDGRRTAIPMESGQAAFGAIQEIVGKLQADPSTDWSKVDIDALRQHLIDMDEVTLHAAAQKEPIENGVRIKVTGNDRTLEAIQRMVPDHAREIDGMNGWTVRATAIPNGVDLVVTAHDPAEVQKIRALGFLGIMVQGSHHQTHHFAGAKGQHMH